MSSVKALLNNIILPKFSQSPILTAHTFVLWEPCSHSHGEIVPGYVKYLRDLGFEVLVLMTPARLSEGLFRRYSDAGVVHGRMSQRRIRKFVTSIGDVPAGIIVTTAGKLFDRKTAQVNFERIFGPVRPKRILLVDHNPSTPINSGNWGANTITLKNLSASAVPSAMVNPHFFGDVRITPKSNDKTTFLMVGAARANRRNQHLVFDSALALLHGGFDKFEIRMVGKKGRNKVPAELQSHVHELGRVSFSEMYAEVENSDYILTAFEPDNPAHDFYKTYGTTGSVQLAYGFRKPIIINREFIFGTEINDQNSILYGSDTELTMALRLACQIGPGEYLELQNSMRQSADKLFDQSLRNMEALIFG